MITNAQSRLPNSQWKNQLQVQLRNLTGFVNIEIWKKFLMVSNGAVSAPHPTPVLSKCG